MIVFARNLTGFRSKFERRRFQSWPAVRGHITEAPVLRPVFPGLLDLLICSSHKVPPHDDGFTERRTTNDHYSGTASAGQGEFVAIDTKVVKRVWI